MPLRILSLLAGTIIGIAIIWIYAASLQQDQQTAPTTETTGTALIGGSFSLIGQDNNTYTDQDFSGRYMLVYFGYSFCPDVCPLDMMRATMALDILEERGVDLAALQSLFITIDPARDTPAALSEFMPNFHKSFLGLSGTPESIAAAAQAYRVYYGKGEDYGDGDYLMNHSNLFYLMGPDGSFITHFDETNTPEDMATRIEAALGQ